ncbi:hypothetical protein OG909_05080 [Streptomyces sp. NBC_01754]|uniref:hypothetical protein n=1 Tax=Streptomyces sp. NBC_01754 TaxID=2975930 RepID=UPI002DD8E0CB|nr:hypothetical protein [Streptomyces sp. NBC_01754]WSC91711.1 hypothetical protein OG909_05080 [Streptomyces sp. NBC_01754]
MTEQDTKRSTRGTPARGAATALCALVLLVLHAVGGFFVLNALLTESEGSWDSTVTSTVRLMAGLGLATGLLAVAVTATFVASELLRRWWYAIPVALILTAIARMVFAPVP